MLWVKTIEPAPTELGINILPTIPDPDHKPWLLVNGVRFTGLFELHWSGITWLIADETYISTLMGFVCWAKQVGVPITYWTLLFPIAAVWGLKIPLEFKNELATQLPVLGATVNCTTASLLQNGPTFDMFGTGGLSMDTAIVLLSGHKLGLGVDCVL